MNIPDGFFNDPVSLEYSDLLSTMSPPSILQSLHVTLPAIVNTSIVVLSRCVTRVYSLTAAMSFPL